jgi:hypothetical protein
MMEPDKPESYEWMTSEPRQRRRHKQKLRVRDLRSRRAWNRTVAIVSLLAGSLMIGGAAIGAALYFSRPVPPPPQSLAEGEHPRAVTGDPRLVGIWFTDPDLTIDELRRAERMSEREELEKRRTRFRTIVTFTDATLTIQAGTDASTQPYQLVRSDKESAVFKTWFASIQKDEEVRVLFVAPDVLKFDAPRLALMDYFRRIKPPVTQAAPAEEKPAAEK